MRRTLECGAKPQHNEVSCCTRVIPLALLSLALAWPLTPTGADAFVSLRMEGDRRWDAQMFSDGMVLQRETAVPIFGTASAGEPVTVTFAGQEKNTIADGQGKWLVELDPLSPGGPFQLRVTGTGNTVVIDDVLVGDVWLCGGQSNMVLSRVRSNILEQNPNIRAITKVGWSDRPGLVPFTFGKALHEALGVPIGLINNARRGSKIRTWFPQSGLLDPDPAVAPIVAGWKIWGQHYDKRVPRIQPYAIRGVAWWQGESDTRNAEEHAVILPAMIRAWRLDWGIGDFPFLFVQLPSGRGLKFGGALKPLPGDPSKTPRSVVMRQAFIETLEELDTGMITTTDLEGGVHPPKFERPNYAMRLAKLALAKVYGQETVYAGPTLESVSVEDDRMRIRFVDGTAEGLQTSGGPLQGFAISANGQTYVWAQAEIQGDEVVVWSDAMANPVWVRYGAGNRPNWANLFNGAGLAAAPFATDAAPGP